MHNFGRVQKVLEILIDSTLFSLPQKYRIYRIYYAQFLCENLCMKVNWKIHSLLNTCDDCPSDLNDLRLFNEGINNLHKKSWPEHQKTNCFNKRNHDACNLLTLLFCSLHQQKKVTQNVHRYVHV
jgi:hypothetical protein